MGEEVYIHWYTTHGTVKPLIKDHLSNIKVSFLQRCSSYTEPSALYSEGPFFKVHCNLSVCVCVCVCVLRDILGIRHLH